MAEIRQTGGGNYYLGVNLHTIMNTPVLEEAQEYAEREIVSHVEHVPSAY